MDTSAVDFPALSVMILAAAIITAAIGFAGRDGNQRRRWFAAVAVTIVLIAIGLADLLRESPRETHLATLFIGIPLPVLVAMGTERVTRRVRPWLRWLVVFLVTFVALLSGLLIGAAIAPRFLP
jgi:UDP-N-acetylmuramyl pentapeptide phosphotransferase/UDP-N-acetylglucosamine-1-phosphate transferase